MESREIKILAIDDNQDNLTSIKALIKDVLPEAVTLTALNGTKGFELAAAEEPDVILLDIVMPGMDGFEVCKKLKADKKLCDIPVVFVTAIKGDKENRIRALEAGAEAFLAKPVEITELTAQVRAMVKIKHANLAKRDEKERLTALVEEKTLELKKTYAAKLKLLEELNTENETRKKSEQKYHLLFQNLTTGFALHEIIVNDAGQPCDYRFLEINPAFEMLTGLKAIDLIGRTSMEVLPGNEIYWAETYGKVALTGESIHFEHYSEALGKHYEVMAYSPQPGKFATLFLDVSERKLAEQVIQISEKKFRSITEQTGDLIAITDTEGFLTYASPASKELFFCTPEEMCGRNFVEFLDEPDIPKAIAMFRMAIENGEKTKDLELMMKRKDGSLFIGELTGSIFQSGSQKGTMVVIRDISERRQSEQRINDLNKRLSLSLEAANAGTWDWDIQNNTFFWPEAFLKIFGMGPDTVPGFEAWSKSLHPEDVEIASKNIQVAIDERTDLLQDYRIILPGGGQRWIRATGKVTYQNDVPIRMVGLCMDITRQKRADEQLLTSEAKFRAVAELSPMAIYSSSGSDQKAIYINQTFYKIFGFSREDVPTIGHWWQKAFPDEKYRQQVIDRWVFNIEQADKNNSDVEALECICTCKDGSEKSIAWVGKTIGEEFWAFGYDFTELKQTEEKLRDEKNRIRTILDQVGDPIFVKDDEHRITLANQAFYDLFCMDEKSVIGYTLVEAVPENEMHQFLKIDRSVLDTGIPDRREEELTVGNFTRTIISRKTRFIDESGKKFLVGSIHDITERKRAEEALQENENKFKAIFENNSAAMAIIEPDTTISMVNKAYCQISGYTSQEVVGMSWIKQIPPADLDRLKEYNQRRLLNPNDAPDKYEFTFLHKNGAIKHALMSVAMIHSNKKIVTSFVDITERKRAEEVSKNEQALTNAIIESIPGAFYMLDESGQYVRWNAYQRDEIIGKPDDLVGITNALDTIHPDDRELLQSKIMNVLANGVDETVEGRVLLRGGPAFRWLLMTGRRMLIDDRPFLVGIGIDITESKSAENKIRLLNETLELRVSERTSQLATINKELAFHLSELEQFSYVSNHDLREPLRTLTQFTKLFNEKYAGKLDEEGEKYIEFISKSAVRMSVLVKDLLDYSLLGKESVKTIVDCNKIVDAVLSDLDDSIKRSHAKISFQNLPIVNGYETEVRLLFQNLVENAIKYKKKDVVPEITILVESHKKEWLFSIMDNGIGIDQKHYEKIFIIFQRLHNRTEFEGTGIGLAQCKKIVELHGGKIWVESTSGAGSTFKFTIPKA